MDNEVIIRAEGLGKQYVLGQAQERYTSLRDVLASKAKAPFRRFKNQAGGPTGREAAEDEFWALRDVSFEVRRGEVIGIIGRNGAGKSTLLKILSRITEPTAGRVTLKGRVASLLEVGTGFHPELTGRENIYLNGAILGMHRREIRAKFDEIVAFAEVERFLDTPVKRYSSGMYVRLAFAVAAHLEPEILIVDEVLAVGDAEFQKKCLGKMQDVARGEGRTVLFVSHNMEAVIRLCTVALLLRNGQVQQRGETYQVAAEYFHGEQGMNTTRRWNNPASRPGNQVARLYEVRVHDETGNNRETFDVRQTVGITMIYEVLSKDIPLVDDFNLFNDQGLYVFASHNVSSPFYNRVRTPGCYKSTVWIPPDLLTEGSFTVSAALLSLEPFTLHYHEEQVVSFHVNDPMEGGSARGALAGHFPGAIRPLLAWDVVRTTPSTVNPLV